MIQPIGPVTAVNATASPLITPTAVPIPETSPPIAPAIDPIVPMIPEMIGMMTPKILTPANTAPPIPMISGSAGWSHDMRSAIAPASHATTGAAAVSASPSATAIAPATGTIASTT